MRWLISALGVVLTLGGAASILSGVPYIRIEFGWTEVIAGTTALSAGILTLGLGAVLGALRRLELRLVAFTAATAGVPASAPGAAEPMLPVETDLANHPSEATIHQPDVLSADVEHDAPPKSSSRPLMGRVRSRLTTMGVPDDGRAESSVTAVPLRSTEASPSVGPASSSQVRPRVPLSTLPETDGRTPPLLPAGRRTAGADAGTGSLQAPTVVGRYESGGASYVLFSDGTIEVETEAGTHRFASMEELKVYIDQQDGSAAG